MDTEKVHHDHEDKPGEEDGNKVIMMAKYGVYMYIRELHELIIELS